MRHRVNFFGYLRNMACPKPTQDIGLNTKNRQLAIDKYLYGPPNPQQPSLLRQRRLGGGRVPLVPGGPGEVD